MSTRPFVCVPGTDASRDRSPIDIAGYYYDQRAQVAEDSALLHQLIAGVDWTNDLASSQWAQWYSAVPWDTPASASVRVEDVSLVW